jgi:hypothetical protein
MSAPAIPRVSVDPQPVAVPHRFGLFAAASLLETTNNREFNGVEYEAVCAPRVDLYPAGDCELPDGFTRAKTPQPTVTPVQGTPFAVYAADTCALGCDERIARDQLRQRLSLGEETAVERAIAGGALSWPHMADPSVISTTAPVEMEDAVGLLEKWLALNYGGVGVLHAPMTAAGRVKRVVAAVQGPRALTLLGSSWVFGAGYTGRGPEGTADDGALWLYATPPVRIRRSPVLEPAGWTTGGFDRAQNQGFLLVERTYVVDWPCGSAAVKTSLTRPDFEP